MLNEFKSQGKTIIELLRNVQLLNNTILQEMIKIGKKNTEERKKQRRKFTKRKKKKKKKND